MYDIHTERYEEALEVMKSRDEQLEIADHLGLKAQKLVEMVLRAREADNEFQRHRDQKAKVNAQKFMKTIYLTQLSMRKLAKRTDNETPVASLSKAVTEYRKAFGAFTDAIEGEHRVSVVKRQLDQASRRVSTIAATIHSRVQTTHQKLKTEANRAREEVAAAVSTNTGAMYAVSLLAELRLAQHEYKKAGDPMIDERVELIVQAMGENLNAMAEDYTEDSELIEEMLVQLSNYRKEYRSAKKANVDQDAAIQSMRDVESRVVITANQRTIEATETMSALHSLGRNAILLFTVLAIALGIVVSMLMGRSITRPLNALTSRITRLARGEADVQIPEVERRDEIGEMAQSMGIIRETGAIALRAKKTLENTTGCLMMVDENGFVALVNPAFRRLAGEVAGNVAADLPGFARPQFEGQPLDEFHNDHELGLDRLGQLSDASTRRIEAGDRTFEIQLNPIHDDDGCWIGTVIEWWDQTARLRLEAEVDSVVAAAVAGDFSQRMILDGKQGFMRNLAESINQLSTVVDHATNELGAMLEAMASGELGRRIEADFQGELGELKDHANRMSIELTRIVGQIQDSAHEVQNAAAEITAGTEDLSYRTEQAASNLEEVAASTEEMAATVKQNADNAKNASQLAGSTDQSAKTGGGVVKQVVTAMSGIEKSAKKITAIISVVDEIAFQTNLLALNASVEAARAGEAGKGFAVVAQEVRQLAQRSAQAADDIKTVIQESNSQVKDGVLLVDKAGDSLTEILGSIGKVTVIVNEISNASQEQALGVQEINGSISSMDEMTQQNSALVEESTASARTLSDQAKKLTELMTFFNINSTVGSEQVRPTRQQPLLYNKKASGKITHAV